MQFQKAGESKASIGENGIVRDSVFKMDGMFDIGTSIPWDSRILLEKGGTEAYGRV